ncbi:tyrosine-type recombinase/integrase [Cryobacterium sp. GrIS_2_6]|uniref:tyrosine-type recombinase/integrase n=1 Tax=Cryobacterium sp. GrIS_2_6 TaxID=3162785 RepID=UPI002E094DE1|nr:tyrosine-type recombinase/integrase [Cryobacterium psychrotolerans]MEC5151404.1 integrase [Cryobacterium psychrotolerans]
MGSITPYETVAGKRYRARYRKPDHSSTERRGFSTKKAAELFLASIEVSKARGEFVDATASRSHIDVLGDEWLNNQSHLKPSSLRPIESAWRLHVQPFWGKRSVGSIRHSEVQGWVTELSKRKGATLVIRAFGILASILDVAVKDRRISSNAARGVNLPRKPHNKHVYLSHQQVQLLADNAGRHSTLLLFLSYTGLRWGEATALRVRSLDTTRRRANVTENAVSVGGPIIVGTPKSHEFRSVPYPEFLTDLLAKACAGKDQDELVFGAGLVHVPLPDSRRGWRVSAVRKAQAIDATFQRVTVHDLRHTAASLAISAGANVKAVQKMLGHASAAMTLDTYADLFDDDLDAVGIALNQAKKVSDVGKPWANPESLQ